MIHVDRSVCETPLAGFTSLDFQQQHFVQKVSEASSASAGLRLYKSAGEHSYLLHLKIATASLLSNASARLRAGANGPTSTLNKLLKHLSMLFLGTL